MGNSCLKPPKKPKNVFTLRKISDSKEVQNNTNGESNENPSILQPNTPLNFNNISPRRKSSFFQHSNQNNSKVTFKDGSISTAFHKRQSIQVHPLLSPTYKGHSGGIHNNPASPGNKRGSIQISPLPVRVIRETSTLEKRRTSEGLKMINQ